MNEEFIMNWLKMMNTKKKKKFLYHYLDNVEIYGFHNLFLKNLNNSITSAMNFFALQKSSQFSFL